MRQERAVSRCSWATELVGFHLLCSKQLFPPAFDLSVVLHNLTDPWRSLFNQRRIYIEERMVDYWHCVCCVHAHVHMCVTDLVKKQFVLWSVYCCSAAIQKIIERTQEWWVVVKQGYSLWREFSIKWKKPYIFFPAIFKSWNAFVSVKPRGDWQLLAKQEASVNHFYFHNGMAAVRILKISAILLPVSSPLFAGVDQCDRCCHDELSESKEGEQREAEKVHKSLWLHLLLLSPPWERCGSSWKRRCWSELPWICSAWVMLSSCQSRGLCSPAAAGWKIPPPQAGFSCMPQTSCEKAAF